MDSTERSFERQRQDWLNRRRLGVDAARCIACPETDPICFRGNRAEAHFEGKTLLALCERCRRRRDAPTDSASLTRKWKLLRAAGCTNERCYCGEENPFCLEADHVDGQKTSSEVIAICINCHLKRTSRQQTEYPQDQGDPLTPIRATQNRLRGIAEHLERMSELARDAAQQLQALTNSEKHQD